MNPLSRYLCLWVQRRCAGFDPRACGKARSFADASKRPVFIVGAPRTGSTLLYQLMIRHMQVAYLSNVMALIPSRMVLLAGITRRWLTRQRSLKESHHGYVPGWLGPNEGGAVYRSWFERDINDQERQAIRNTLILISELAGGPFISKNLLNSLRLMRIREVFPEMRIIHLRRNPLYTGQSILMARKHYSGGERGWLSAKPAGYESIQDRDPEFQVLWQVQRLDAIVSRFICETGASHLVVNYRDLCRQPDIELERMSHYLQVPLMSVPESGDISAREAIRLSSSEWSRLLRYYEELYGGKAPVSDQQRAAASSPMLANAAVPAS